MNTFFNLKRFGLLMRHDLLLNRIKYLMTLLVLALAIYSVLVYMMNIQLYYFSISKGATYSGNPGSGYQQWFTIFMIGLGVFVGLSFADLGNKVKRTSALLIPASNFEKFLHPFLLRGILGAILYFITFWLAAQLARLTAQSFPNIQATNLYILPFKFSMIFNDMYPPLKAYAVLAFLSMATFLYSIPLFFKKMALLKTVNTLFVVGFLYLVVMVLLTHLFYPEIDGFKVHCDEYMITKEISNWVILMYYIASISWIFLLLIGYFKLKELKL